MNQTVLVIDDSHDIHALLTARLRSEGVTLMHAFNGHDGLTMAAERHPDLILLDVDMPDHDGFEVCRTLKRESTTVGIPVMFLTGADAVYNKVEGFDLGAVDYITKPFDASELRARVGAALRTKRLHDMLATRARIDGLTGLWNRGFFEDRVTELDRHPERPAGLLLIDIDHFKRVNDTFGHPHGDRVLQGLAEVLTAESTGEAVACRYGGEEFAVLLPGADASAAEAFAARVHAGVARMKALNSAGDRVTVSIGVGSTATRGVGVRALIEPVDRALYSAKRGGRDRTARITDD